ncbi:MAG: tetratricopeptide repeat protein [Verrucomicrobia bacterium]|nr:MAG: tetratricopeptide repeat protein [Verrucomicrobiota bacterium]
MALVRAVAQEPAPDRVAFDAAERAWAAGLHERAAAGFGGFAKAFPDSTLRAAAAERAALAGAEVVAGQSQWRAAAAAFGAFLRDFPASTNRAFASVREASAWERAGAHAEARQRLEAPDGPFQTAARQGGPKAVLFSGWLVLAEARLAAGDAAGAEAAAQSALVLAAGEEQRWAVEHLRHEVATRTGPPAVLVAAAERLRALAGAGTNGLRRAESATLLARALAASGASDQAEALWEENLRAGVPLEHQREAIVRLGQRLVERGELVKARLRLERFLADRGNEPGWGRVNLALGQVLFRQQSEARRTAATASEAASLGGLALAQLARVLTNAPEPELVGPAQFARGWCLWDDAASSGNAERMREAEEAFLAAANALPSGPEQATARFKLADAQLSRQDAAGALTNYLAVAEGYAGLGVVDRELRPLAWQQVVLAGVGSGNMEAATRGMDRLLKLHPEAEITGRSALLLGQSLVRQGESVRGRALLSAFSRKFPDSPVTADARLALASAYLAEQRWTNALQELDDWVGRYTNHPALAQAEFDRAVATARSGSVTNAVDRFRSLTQRFVTNQIAQSALLWLGSHFEEQGDYVQAEQAYVAVVTNAAWRGSPAVQRARLDAGQAALARGVTNAVGYFIDLLNDPSAPEEFRAPAYYYLGESKLQLAPAGTNGPLTAFSGALEAFAGAARYTNHPLVVAAWGRMAYCHVQLAAQNAVGYDRAAELYQRVVDSPLADAAARAKAKVWLGQIAERQASGRGPADAAALREKALNHYLDVTLGRLLRPGESLPPRQLEEAGIAAGRVLEERRRWDEAAGLYEQLARDLPQLKPVWDARRQRVLAAKGG